MNEFRTELGETIFRSKYALSPDQTWRDKARSIVDDICGHGYYGQYDKALLSKDERDFLVEAIASFKFLPGGRYIYYAGRTARFYNNCYLLRGEEDTREEWGALVNRSMSCLTTGGGIGIDYSVFRPAGRILQRTGGQASGPIPLMMSINEIGRNVMQGGSRRSAIYASLNWQHEDAERFLRVKNWKGVPVGNTGQSIWDIKQSDFNYPAPLDMTNISLNYDDKFLKCIEAGYLPKTFIKNCKQALMTAEPGFSFNFGDKQNETLRNACTEVTSEDDSDVCNLGSINMANISSIYEFSEIVSIATKFLVCGTLRADLPYNKVHDVREKNRRLGLGLMGIHEWLLQRGYGYEVVDELHCWLETYQYESEVSANNLCTLLSISQPVAYRAIAPTGTIGIIAGTTTGIEPLYAVAYKRRYLKNGDKWHYKLVIDAMSEQMITEYGVDPDSISSAVDLSQDPEARIKFQANVQDYVDMAISSTINLPAWGSCFNNEDRVESFARILAKYAHRLRGFTCYPDGARGGQPITAIPYNEAKANQGVEYEENSETACKSGVCGV